MALERLSLQVRTIPGGTGLARSEILLVISTLTPLSPLSIVKPEICISFFYLLGLSIDSIIGSIAYSTCPTFFSVLISMSTAYLGVPPPFLFISFVLFVLTSKVLF